MVDWVVVVVIKSQLTVQMDISIPQFWNAWNICYKYCFNQRHYNIVHLRMLKWCMFQKLKINTFILIYQIWSVPKVLFPPKKCHDSARKFSDNAILGFQHYYLHFAAS